MTRPAHERVVVFIATPLAEEQVERIRAVDPDRLDVLYEPELLPPRRYSIDHTGRGDFVRTPEQEARWRAGLARADVLWDFPPDAQDGTPGLEIARKVKWIQTTSSGIGQRVRRLGLHDSDVIITNAAGVHAEPLAEFAFLTLLMHSRRLRHLEADQQAHRWERFTGDELAEKTLAVVGAGRVGRRVVQVGRAFGMRVIALARPGSSATAADYGVDVLFAAGRFHDLLAQADALVLSVPHTSETEGMMGRAAFAALKPGAVFVNIARGSIVDEPALIESLQAGRIALAGLDVFGDEPLPADSPFWDMPNVLVSPHSSANADSENGKITDIFCHNLRCWLDGRLSEMRNVFNKERMY